MRNSDKIIKLLFGIACLAIFPRNACAQVTQDHSPAFDSIAQSQVDLTSDNIGTYFDAPASRQPPTYYEGGTFLASLGPDGSKQPRDFGVNANIGLAGGLSYSAPVNSDLGIGFQIGTRFVFNGNAVQVFELLGESKDSFQSFTTVGIFQRLDNGFSYGAVYDFVTQDSFDNFTLGQWRLRASKDISPIDELGVTLNFSGRSDTGSFNSIPVVLDPIEQLHIYLRRRWQSGVMTSGWVGVADGHSEENAVTGTLPRKTNQILLGAEIHAPLNQWLAIYGETNIMMPADTGAVDAYLGIEFAPQGSRRSRSKRNRFRALLPVASSPSFTTDLNRR